MLYCQNFVRKQSLNSQAKIHTAPYDYFMAFAERGPKTAQLGGVFIGERKIPRYRFIKDEESGRQITIVDVHGTIRPDASPHLTPVDSKIVNS